MSAVQSPISVLQSDIEQILNAPSNEVPVAAKATTIQTLVQTTQQDCPELQDHLQKIFDRAIKVLAGQLTEEMISNSQGSPQNLMARYQEKIRVLPAPLLALVKKKIADCLRENLENSLHRLSEITRRARSADQLVANIKEDLLPEYSLARQVVQRLSSDKAFLAIPLIDVPYSTHRDAEAALAALCQLHSVQLHSIADESAVSQLAGLPNLDPLRAAIPAVFRARRLFVASQVVQKFELKAEEARAAQVGVKDTLKKLQDMTEQYRPMEDPIRRGLCDQLRREVDTLQKMVEEFEEAAAVFQAAIPLDAGYATLYQESEKDYLQASEDAKSAIQRAGELQFVKDCFNQGQFERLTSDRFGAIPALFYDHIKEIILEKIRAAANKDDSEAKREALQYKKALREWVKTLDEATCRNFEKLPIQRTWKEAVFEMWNSFVQWLRDLFREDTQPLLQGNQ
jgi:HPt (histidine-containing phosphotransfer) domain-containing protein